MKQCPCPMPPGGQVTCEDHQVAICRVIGGVPHGECISPPDTEMLGGSDGLYRWVVEQITGRKRARISPEDIRMLHSGRYFDPRTKEEVTFNLPKQFLVSSSSGTQSL